MLRFHGSRKLPSYYQKNIFDRYFFVEQFLQFLFKIIFKLNQKLEFFELDARLFFVSAFSILINSWVIEIFFVGIF